MLNHGLLRLKQGASLALDLLLTDDLGSPIALAAGMVSVAVADPYGNPVATLTPVLAAQQGWATLAADTALWPLGRLAAEVHVTAAGQTAISDSFTITIERPVTA